MSAPSSASPRPSAGPAPRDRPSLEQCLAALQGQTRRAPARPAYQLGLLLVALVMLLPVLYVAIIALVTCVLAWYAVVGRASSR